MAEAISDNIFKLGAARSASLPSVVTFTFFALKDELQFKPVGFRFTQPNLQRLFNLCAAKRLFTLCGDIHFFALKDDLQLNPLGFVALYPTYKYPRQQA